MARPLTVEEKERLTERALAAAAYAQSGATSGEIEELPSLPPATDIAGIIDRRALMGDLIVGKNIGAGSFWERADRFTRYTNPVTATIDPTSLLYSLEGLTVARRAYNNAVSALSSSTDDLTSFGLVATSISDLAGVIDSPFERLDELRSERARFRALLQRLRLTLSTKYRDQLIARTELLAAELDDEEPGRVPAVDSLQSMATFLTLNPLMSFPEIVLTPDGHFRGEWHRGRDRHLAVTFLSAGEVRYVIFAKRPGARLLWPMAKVDRQSGVTSVDRLMDLLAPFAPRRWVENEGQIHT